MGVVGGQNQFPSSYDLYATAPIGSDLSGITLTATTIGFAEGALTRITSFPTVGGGIMDSNKLWTANVPTLTANDFYGASGINPDSAIDGSGIINEGLWEATPSGTSYLGYFTLDTTGDSPSLTFTSIQVVPEPTTVALLVGGGLLLCSVGRRFGGKNV